jgi:hypothetical protein
MEASFIAHVDPAKFLQGDAIVDIHKIVGVDLVETVWLV